MKLRNIAFLLILSACTSGRYSDFKDRRNLDFNTGWRFMNDPSPGASEPGFDDSAWRVVDLPHDWGIEEYPRQDSVLTGPFKRDQEGGADVGYLRGGTGWYRKSFTLDETDQEMRVLLHFDGVQSEMELWVNGQDAGRHVYGYTPFYFDITPFLNEPGVPNQISVKVTNPGLNSRWYNGAGIYRDVTISYLDPVYLTPWGVFISAGQINDDEANIDIDLKFYNKYFTNTGITLQAEIYSPGGKLINSIESPVTTGTDSFVTHSMDMVIPDPELWGPGHPSLYSAVFSLFLEGEKVDQYRQTFGIRSIEYSAEKGFLLNGEALLLKGACMHHDNGLLGAAAFRRAEERRVRIMKENGYNAIRTSHNPPSAAFLDACDRLGMLVIDESFDMWYRPKRPNDYHQYFEQWWKTDLESMVLRDRNHPSVIMWSFGNEVQERISPEGIAIAVEMAGFIRGLDPTRPVTQAICGFWDNPGKEWDDSAPAFGMLDIGGYNYQWVQYETDHQKFQQRIMFGSESVPKEAYENWRLVKEKPYVIGDFVWTGMDYIGESGIGHSQYYSGPVPASNFLMPWPWYLSWCGDIGITGTKKPQSYFRDVVWERSRLELMVHEPQPEGNREGVSFWGWPLEEHSWNWTGHEGNPLTVNVYSSYPEVMLELNGRLIGKQSINPDDNLTASFNVPFEPGVLKAYGMLEGEELDSVSLVTTGPVSGIRLIPERSVIDADRNEIVYIRVVGTDEQGRTVPDADQGLTLTVSGEGELLAAGNASPLAPGSLQDGAFNLFRGEALVIARSSGVPGSITVKVVSDMPPTAAESVITVNGPDAN